MRIGVMCSGKGTNFENILRTCNKHEVVLMIHNKKECGAIKVAEKFGVPHCYISHKDEERMIDLLNVWRVQLVVLAGYMRILSPNFINSFPERIINVHPSLLPKYKGIDAVEQALESGDDVTGCTVHIVTEELDSGRILLQGKVPIEKDDTVKTLTKRIQRSEYGILPMAINNFTL